MPHTWRSCSTRGWDMPHIWMSHGTCEPQVNGHVGRWAWHAMSHTWMSHVPHINESCHIYEWVISCVWMSHITCINESCHTYEWVMAHIWMSHGTRISQHMGVKCPRVINHVTHMDESCYTHGWVMALVRRSMAMLHDERDALYHTYEWVISHIWMSRGKRDTRDNGHVARWAWRAQE